MSQLELEGYQRAYLRSKAHKLDPLVNIGKAGLTDNINKALVDVLRVFELVKVKFADTSLNKKEISEQLALSTSSTLIAITGNVAIFYKESSDKEARNYQIPKRKPS